MKFWMKFIKFLLKINRFFKIKSLLFSPFVKTNFNRRFCPLALFFALLCYFYDRDGALPAAAIHSASCMPAPPAQAAKFILSAQIKFTATPARPHARNRKISMSKRGDL